MLFRTICVHWLELLELHHRGDEGPGPRPSQGHRHLLHPLPRHLRPDHRRIPHFHERVRSVGVRFDVM